MKIEVHSRMHQKPQAGNQGARMIGEDSRIASDVENFPGRPKKKNQKDKSAKAADRARFGQCFRVIVMAVIYDQPVIIPFRKAERLPARVPRPVPKIRWS